MAASVFGGSGKGTLCIDIGSNSVKFVKMEVGRVVDYGYKEIGEAFDVPSILRELIKDYKPKEVFSFVSGPSVSVRQAPFPKMNRRELKDAIMLRLEKYSPFTLDEAILDFKTLGPVREAGAIKDNVMVVAARKDVVSDHISTLKKAGLEPSAIGVIPFALHAAAKKYAGIRPDETVCILDIGAEFTDIVFVKGERLDLSRVITTAGNAITEAMTVAITTEEGQLALDAYDAERLKRQYGIPDEDSDEKLSSGIFVKRLATLQRPALERFGAEINRSVDFYRREYGEAKIDRILICGGTAVMRGLKDYIQSNLGVPTELFDPFRSGNLYKPDAKPADQFGFRLVIALGLLHDHSSVDLLPGEMRSGRSQSKDTQIAVIVGLLWVALLAVGYVVIGGTAAAKARQAARSDQELEQLKKEGQEYFALERKVADLETRQKTLIGIVGERDLTVPAMARITQVVPGNVQLNTLTLSGQNSIKMTGVVSGEPQFLDIELSRFLIGLERDRMFQRVSLTSKRRTVLQGEAVLEFDVECVME